MSAEHLKSTYLTNATATPKTTNNAHLRGHMIEAIGVITPSATSEANSTHRFVRVPSNARISAVLLKCAAFTTAGAVDIGVYQTAENGGAVVDADLFASAQVLTAALDWADKTYESTEYTIAESEKPLWEVLGIAADPCIEYDIAATVTTAFNGGSIFGLKVRYVA